MLARMGRKKIIEKSILVRLLPGVHERVVGALDPGEKLADLAREAIDRELERRESQRQESAKGRRRRKRP